MTDRLDALLAQPLAHVADDGFSARVVVQLDKAKRRAMLLTYLVVALAALPLLFVIPMPVVNGVVTHLPAMLGASAPLGLACGLLCLTLSFEDWAYPH